MEQETQQLIQAEGERIKVIKMYGEVLDEVTLADLKRQTGNIDAFDVLVLEIASPGGSVAEGLDIMVWLDQLSAAGKKVVTVVTANSYSIASLIMLVAEIKLISRHGEVMVHNPMVPLLEYVNANELQKYIDNLRALENTMYELYEFFTGLDQAKIKDLMDNETYLSPQDSVDLGFADMIIDIKPKSYEMTSNTQNKINMSKTLNILNKVIGMVNKSEFINQIYSDLEGSEIEIYQADPATYSVGDKTYMEEGEVVLSDGSRLTIVEGKIAEINRDAEVSMDEESVVDGEFNEGAAPEEMMDEPKMEEEKMDEHEGEEPSEEPSEEVPAEEEQEEVIEEVVEELTNMDEEAKEEEMVEEAIEEEMVEEKMEEEVSMDDDKMMDEKMDGHGDEEMMDEESKEVAMDEEAKEEEAKEEMLDRDDYVSMDEYNALQERLAAMEEKMKEYEMKFEALSKFENVATEAIDTLASNTVSTFKPEAKSVATNVQPKGSIFSQLKAKRGL